MTKLIKDSSANQDLSSDQEGGDLFSGRQIAYMIQWQGWNDVAEHILTLCQSLKNEFNIHVIIIGQSDNLIKAYCLSLEKAGAIVHCVYSKKLFSLKTAKEIKNIVANNKIQIIHSHLQIADMYGYALKRFNSHLNWVSTIHHFRPLEKTYKHWLMSYPKILKHCHWRVFASNYIHHNNKILNLNEKNSVIYYAIDPASIHQKTTQENNKKILFVSALTKQNGCEDLIKAFALIKSAYPKFKLQIIGDGPEKIYLERLAESLKIPDNVEFLSHAIDISSNYERCAVVVLPISKGGVPLSLIRAMGHSKPIIAMGSDSILECITDQESALIVKPRDIYQLSLSLKKVLKDNSMSEQLGMNAHQIFKEKFLLSDMMEKHLVVYRML